MSKPRALVIGGSLGGLIAAHLLRSVGWDAVVFERNAVDLPSRGAGIGTHSPLTSDHSRVGKGGHSPSKTGVNARMAAVPTRGHAAARLCPPYHLITDY